jgi:hypothetical protein
VAKSTEVKLAAGFKWRDAKDVPLLKEQAWLSIEASSFGSDFGNPLYAVSCKLHQ